MKKKDTLKKISPYLIKELNINEKTKYKRTLMDASTLIVPERIDLIAKIKYIKAKELDYRTKYFVKLYKKTIESFSQGSYKEPGNSSKNSFSKYIEDFNNLIIDIKENKFNPNKSLIPLGNNNAIIDGAHRLSIAYYFNQKVDCLKFEDFSVKYNYEFFKNNLLEEEYLDYLILEYCKLKKQIYVILTKNSYETKNINDNYKIIYKKNIPFNNILLKNLLFYFQKESINDIKSLNLIVFETNKIEKFKNKILSEYNSSLIYLSDTYEKSIEILEMFLNKNSINFLSNNDIHLNSNLNNQLNDIKRIFKEHNLDSDDYVFTSDIVMELYNLKVCKSIGYLSYNNKRISSTLIKNISYNKKNYTKALDDLLYNPNNYFYYNSLKFLTLKNIEKRSIKEKIIVNTTLIKSINLKMILNTIKVKLKIKTRNIKTKLREILNKVGLLKIRKK